MSDFYLLDTYGGYNCITLHPFLEGVAFDAGCMIVVWNMKTDSKINLMKHDTEVVSISFLHGSVAPSSAASTEETLFSLDQSGHACLWDLHSGTCFQDFRLSSRRVASAHLTRFADNERLLCIAENESGSTSYGISLWTQSKGLLVAKAKSEEFAESECKALCPLPATRVESSVSESARSALES